MNTKTKIALVIGAAAIGGYFLWKSRQPEKKSATGDCGCNKKSSIGRAGPVDLPNFGRPVILRDR